VRGSLLEVERIGTSLYRIGLCMLGLSVFGFVLTAYFRLLGHVNIPSTPAQKAATTALGATTRLLREIRYVAGGLLCVLAGRGLRGRKPSGWLVARNAALVSSLFGLSSAYAVWNGNASASSIAFGVSWFAAVWYECHWLSRREVKTQFQAADAGMAKPVLIVLALVAMVAIATSGVGTSYR